MENQSQNQSSSRHQNNRPDRRRRNRRSQSQSKGAIESQSNRSNRNSSRSRRRKPLKQSFWQKLLSWFGFGKAQKSIPQKQNSAIEKTSANSSTAPVREPKKSHRTRTEVTNNRLYVGNLDFSTAESDLEQLFSGVGNVLSAEVVTNPRTQQSKGFAFVEMGSLQEAIRAVSVLDDKEFMGRRLVVNGAREDQRRPDHLKEEQLAESTVAEEN